MTFGCIEEELLHPMWQSVRTIGRKINFEQIVNVKFCFELGTTAAERHQIMQKLQGDECLSRPTTYKWFERLEEDREDLNDEENLGQPRSTVNEENVEIVREFMKKRAEIFVALHGNGIEYVQRLNLSHFDRAFGTEEGLVCSLFR